MKKIKLTTMQLFVILLFCVSMTIQTPAAPTLLGNGKITFTSDRDGNQEIYLMNADGSGQTRLTNNSVRDDYPTWSPDGRKIAFLRQSGGISSINLMNADGTNQTQLTTFIFRNNQYYPYPFERFGMAWSPDRAKIAFQDSTDISIINIDGSNRVNLTNGQFINYEPSWSPDGSRIAFARSIYSHGVYTEIYTMNADGRDVRKITTSPDYTDGSSPDWSPDGGQITITAGADALECSSLALVNPDGTNLQFIFYFYNFGFDIDQPKWSPDGTKIVFYGSEYCYISSGCSNSISQIWVINRAGSGLTRLTNNSPNNFHPDWQPLTPELGLIVTRSDDRNATCASGDCSLREAVNAANASATDDMINFATGLTRITLTNEIVINKAGTLTINGLGANNLTIDGGAGTNRIFYTNLATMTISGVTLTGGNGIGSGGLNSGFGGAILAIGGSLTLDGVHVTGNSADFGGGAFFPGIGNTHIINSTFSDNFAGDCAGFHGNRVTVVNSTISGNTSYGNGGGICVENYDTTLRNVTITNNTAATGGGIYLYGGILNFGNTIVAGNIAGDGPEIYIQTEIYFQQGTVTSVGGNLVGVNPMLGTLQNNGGTTPTHALLSGSPAIDKGLNSLVFDPFNNSALQTDQRGLTRILGSSVDIGAFEFAPAKSRKRIRFF